MPSKDKDNQLEQEDTEGYESSEDSLLLDNPEVEGGEEDEPTKGKEDNENLLYATLCFAKEQLEGYCW